MCCVFAQLGIQQQANNTQIIYRLCFIARQRDLTFNTQHLEHVEFYVLCFRSIRNSTASKQHVQHLMVLFHCQKKDLTLNTQHLQHYEAWA